MFKEYPDVVDVLTLAKMLQVSRKAAYGLLADGRIKYRKIGRIYRIPKNAIIDFMTK
jgi:excisionase family DNA binding protein